MMAERKKRVKMSLNPRGNNWSKDSNKFGQKLLEKMGWSEGKGLGANEDGATSIIRVSYKNDTQGMGFKDRDDQWTEHETHFSQLLNNLAGPKETNGNDKSAEKKIDSLEQRSKQSRARVHYQKFTRGKDLSRRSEKDLACLFGRKSLDEVSKPKNEKVEEQEEEKSHGVVTHNGGNMFEYFKKKLPNFKSTATVTPKNDDSDYEIERPSFGFGFGKSEEKTEEPERYEKFDSKSERYQEKLKDLKPDPTDNFRKRCFGLGFDKSNQKDGKQKNSFTSFVKASDTVEKKEPLKFSIIPSKNSTENENEDNEKSSFGFGSRMSKIQASFMSFVKGKDDKENEEVVESGKKRKKRSDEDDCNEEKVKKKKKKNLESDTCTPNDESLDSKKKDKASKMKPSFVSFISESTTEEKKENGFVDLNGENQSLKKKKKKNKDKNSDVIVNGTLESVNEECTVNESQISVENNESLGLKKKDKKKKSKKVEDVSVEKTEEIVNGSFDTTEDIQILDESLKKKKKKNKQKNCEEISNESYHNNMSEEVTPAKKGKKRKSQSELDVAFTPVAKKFKNFEDLHTLQDAEKILQTPNGKNIEEDDIKIISNVVLPGKHKFSPILEEPESPIEEKAEEKSKSEKKSKRKSKSDETIVDTPQSEETEKLEKKNKKRKSKGLEDVENTSTVEVETPKKKDKKKAKVVEEISTVDENDNGSKDTEVVEEIETPKKSKKNKKKSKEIQGIDNPCLESFDQSLEVSQTEVKKKSKSKKKKEDKLTNGIENTAFNESSELDCSIKEVDNQYEVKQKKKKEKVVENCEKEVVKEKKKKQSDESVPDLEKAKPLDRTAYDKIKRLNKLAIVNPCFEVKEFQTDTFLSLEVTPNKYEVKRSKKIENAGIDNPGLDLTSPKPINNTDDLPVADDSSLMLNVVCTPIIKKETDKKVQRRKSVRFSDVNQSIFINKLDSPADLKRNGGGVVNAAFDEFGNCLEEKMDDLQAEVENDLNEAKAKMLPTSVGEIPDPQGENELLPSGDVMLRLKYAKFGKLPPWMKKKDTANPKSSYRHLIKGDIVLGFKNTNMHNIQGYDANLKKSST